MIVWSVAKQMVAECLRMKIALVFLVLLGVVLFGLPFRVEGDSSLTGAVQSFLSFSLSATTVLLSILTILMSKSLSDELVNRQLFIVLTKPVPRWQFLVGKWVGIVLFNVVFLFFSGLIIYGMVFFIRATHPPLDARDKEELENQVLVARHTRPMELPWDEFRKAAEADFERKKEQGFYDKVENFNKEEQLRQLRTEREWRWRFLRPMEVRNLNFSDVHVDPSSKEQVQFRYKTEVKQYPTDEIYRAQFIFGDPDKVGKTYTYNSRHVVGRFHTISLPVDAVTPDGTLQITIYNRNPFIPYEPDYMYSLELLPVAPPEVYFVVGGMGANLLRLLLIVLCKLMLLAAVALLCATVFSFPVACLTAFSFYILAGTRTFVMEALDFASREKLGWFHSVSEFFMHLMLWVYSWLKILVPDFGYYNAVETLVTGKNVSLIWVLNAVVELGVLRTLVVLGLAILLFQRREIAEVSV